MISVVVFMTVRTVVVLLSLIELHQQMYHFDCSVLDQFDKSFSCFFEFVRYTVLGFERAD